MPSKGQEDAFEDIWGQVEGPSDDEDGEPEVNSEAFTEFAASPGNYMRGASLRRPATPPSPGPGQVDTADDVRSLIDKVMEEALPTHATLAFPEDGTPTLRPRDDAHQVPDTLATAPPQPSPAPVPAKPAPEFKAVPAELSFAQAPQPPGARASQDLSHLTSDLSVDVAPASSAVANSTAVDPPQTDDPLDGDDVALQTAFEPRIARPTAEPALTPSDLLSKVEPKSNAPVLVGLAVALIGLLMILVVKSLL